MFENISRISQHYPNLLDPFASMPWRVVFKTEILDTIIEVDYASLTMTMHLLFDALYDGFALAFSFHCAIYNTLAMKFCIRGDKAVIYNNMLILVHAIFSY